jgi:hypothetical protein
LALIHNTRLVLSSQFSFVLACGPCYNSALPARCQR